MKNKIFFFRNDDVRNKLDDSLVLLTESFIKKGIPLTHAVEPFNVTSEVVNWLLDIKKKHPDLIEIIQHGYNHKLNYKTEIGGKIKKGEFGGDRDYNDQFNDIKKGKELMNKHFNDKWFNAFTFPYGARNNDSIKVLDDLDFDVVNGSMLYSAKAKVYYTLGRIMKREMLFGRKVSWNLRTKPNTNLFQIDLCISFIKSYINEIDECVFNDLDKIKELTNKCSSFNNIGVLFHHRYHNTQAKIDAVDEYLDWLVLNFKNIDFLTQEKIYNKYK